MKERTISAIILMAILIFSMLMGSKVFGIIMTIAAILGFYEFFNIKYEKNKKLRIIQMLGAIFTALICLNDIFYKINLDVIILLPIIVMSVPVIIYNDSKLYSIIDVFYVLAVIYILGFAFHNVIYLRDVNILKCIFIFIIAFITDTYAFVGGSLIGRHTFTSISPYKTIEGCLIGVIMGTLVGGVYYYNMVEDISVFETFILCLFLTILSEVGDLMFSSIKRYFGKKDFSNLIPGHGGILDRFDSVIYVSLGLSLIFSIF